MSVWGGCQVVPYHKDPALSSGAASPTTMGSEVCGVHSAGNNMKCWLGRVVECQMLSSGAL